MSHFLLLAFVSVAAAAGLSSARWGAGVRGRSGLGGCAGTFVDSWLGALALI